MKTIIIQLTSCGDRLKTFDIFDDTNTLIASHWISVFRSGSEQVIRVI